MTDIQNSTLLWEVLPPRVMERAVQLHHAVLREKLQMYRGYETATEVGREWRRGAFTQVWGCASRIVSTHSS